MGLILAELISLRMHADQGVKLMALHGTNVRQIAPAGGGQVGSWEWSSLEAEDWNNVATTQGGNEQQFVWGRMTSISNALLARHGHVYHLLNRLQVAGVLQSEKLPRSIVRPPSQDIAARRWAGASRQRSCM
jgi:hypothetical protein